MHVIVVVLCKLNCCVHCAGNVGRSLGVADVIVEGEVTNLPLMVVVVAHISVQH